MDDAALANGALKVVRPSSEPFLMRCNRGARPNPSRPIADHVEYTRNL